MRGRRPVNAFRGNRMSCRVGAWLGVLAMLVSVVVPLGRAVPAASSPFGTGGYLIVCTALGAKAIPVGDEDERRGGDGRPICPICQVTGLGKSLVPAAAAVMSVPAYHRSMSTPVWAADALPRAVVLVPPVRAPPLAA